MTYRKFIAVILAAALAVTGMTSTPARAGNDDVAKWIAGAVALGVIGAAIANDKKRDRRRDQAVTRYQQQGFGYNGHRDQVRQGYGHRGHQNFGRDQRRALPRGCRVNVRTNRGDVRGFGRRCLLNNYAQYNSLPHQCATRVGGGNGRQGRVIYTGQCLRSHGYSVASRK